MLVIVSRNILYVINEIEMKFHREEDALFNWYDIPGEHDGRLIEFLKQKFCFPWIKTAKPEKIDNMTIKASSEGRSICLTLNEDKTKVILKSDPDIIHELIAKMENDKLNIYQAEKRKRLQPLYNDFEELKRILS